MPQLNEISDNKGATVKKVKVGRGPGSGLGKTCGHGIKGQKSRSGVAINGFEGGQMPLHRRLPKRGFNSLNREIIEIVNLVDLGRYVTLGKIEQNTLITKDVLFSLGKIKNLKSRVKLLGKGVVNSAFKIEVDFCSKAAKTTIEAAGGSVSLI